MSALKFAAVGGVEQLWVNDVFSAYTYTGNSSTQTITNGINLSVYGGLVWTKERSANGLNHSLRDTARGGINSVASNLTGGSTAATGISAFNTNGYAIGSDMLLNLNTATYASWTFRNAPKFFTHTTVVKSAGSNATVDLSTLGTVGMVMVKRTDSTGSWYVWHRSLTAGKLLYLEQTAAEATLGHITVSGTTLTLVNGTIADGTYVVYAWAHDTASDGIVQCGAFTTDGSGNATVTLGWEPQFILTKTSAASDDWYFEDSARGMSETTYGFLRPNSTGAEIAGTNTAIHDIPRATGFYASGRSVSTTYIYLAIRRPNKPPTSGTQVYNAIARTGTGAAATVTGVGFAPDLVFSKQRSLALYEPVWHDRLRGASKQLLSNSTASEYSQADLLTAFGMDGMTLGVDAVFRDINYNTYTYINWFFKRAVGVFDEVCYTSSAWPNSYAHGLGVVPGMLIIKTRSGVNDWGVYHEGIGVNKYLLLNTTAAAVTLTPTFAVSATTFGDRFSQGHTCVAYLFATKAGISKVGSYTGNGSNLTIDCGFTTGARFVLVKRTDSTGDWYVWDSTRGIVAGNDGHLSLNTTAAEVTTDDSIDPDNSGFIVNQLAATNINVTSASYIFLAFA